MPEGFSPDEFLDKSVNTFLDELFYFVMDISVMRLLCKGSLWKIFANKIDKVMKTEQVIGKPVTGNFW